MSLIHPVVSIIIPTYNYGHFILDAITSVISQNYSNYEIIIVDDGSIDNTQTTVRPHLSSKIKYIYQNNSGLSAARNKGIMESQGDFIQFLDADDILGKNVLNNKIEYFDKNPDIYVSVCKTKWFETTQKRNPKIIFKEGWPLYTRHMDIHFFCFNIAPPHAFLFRREVIIKTGYFDTNLKACEDYDYWLRALSLGFSYGYCPNCLVYYRQHDKSMSRNLVQQYTYDSIMHQKLQQLLTSTPSITLLRAEALMAFIAGLLKTILNIYRVSGNISEELIAAYSWGLQELQKSNRSDIKYPFLLYFYYVRALLTLEELTYLIPMSYQWISYLSEAMIKLDISFKKNHLFYKSMKYILFQRDADLLERYRLFKYTLNII